MFEHLAEHAIILVTGPQRSGTTICARMIAHDTGHAYIDEARFSVFNGKKAITIAKACKPCVLQGPGLLKYAGYFGESGHLVVIMNRPNEEIAASLKDKRELVRRLLDDYPDAKPLIEEHGLISLPRVMYANFHANVMGRIPQDRLVGLWYEDLEEHPLWIDKEDRDGWKRRQWR